MSDQDSGTDNGFWNSITPPEPLPEGTAAPPEFLMIDGRPIPGMTIERSPFMRPSVNNLIVSSANEQAWSVTRLELQKAGVAILQSRRRSFDGGTLSNPSERPTGIELLFSPSFGGLVHPFVIEAAMIESNDVIWHVIIEIHLDVSGWRGPYSPASITQRILDVHTSVNALIRRRHSSSRLSFSMRVSADELLITRVEELSAAAMEVIRLADEELLTEVAQDVLVTQFHFAPEYKTACQQYLSYFVEFLRDLTGEEATAELKEDAGHVLFSVTPRNGAEALDSVREALQLYLRLPASPGIENIGSLSRDRAALELQAEVLQLKSKFLFAAAAIDDRDREIAHLRSANEQLIALATTVAGQRAAPEDDEPLIPGAVSLTAFEWGGIKLELPALLRRLRRRKPGKTVLPPSTPESPAREEDER
jgi:hypothetical protein